MKKILAVVIVAAIIVVIKINSSAAQERLAAIWFDSPGDTISYSEMSDSELQNGMIVAAEENSISFRGVYADRLYTISDINRENHTMRLTDENGYPAYGEEYNTRECYIYLYNTGIANSTLPLSINPTTPGITPEESISAPATIIPDETASTEDEETILQKATEKVKNELAELSQTIANLKEIAKGDNAAETVDYIKEKIIPVIAAVLSALAALYLAVVPVINKIKNASSRFGSSANALELSAKQNEENKAYIEKVGNEQLEKYNTLCEQNLRQDELISEMLKAFYIAACNNDELVRKGYAKTIAGILGKYAKDGVKGENNEADEKEKDGNS